MSLMQRLGKLGRFEIASKIALNDEPANPYDFLIEDLTGFFVYR